MVWHADLKVSRLHQYINRAFHAMLKRIIGTITQSTSIMRSVYLEIASSSTSLSLATFLVIDSALYCL